MRCLIQDVEHAVVVVIDSLDLLAVRDGGHSVLLVDHVLIQRPAGQIKVVPLIRSDLLQHQLIAVSAALILC